MKTPHGCKSRHSALFLALLMASMVTPATAIQTIVAKAGDAAPGLTGLSHRDYFYYGQVNNAGQVAYFSWLTDGANSFSSIWRDSTLIAKQGDAAPGLGGVSYGMVETPALNASGQVAYNSSLTGSGVSSSNDGALWRSGTLIAREGNFSNYWSGVNLGSLGYYPRINSAGQVSYSSGLTGIGVTSANDSALWNTGSPVARAGDLAPGLTGVSYRYITNGVPPIGNAGQVAYYSVLTGTGVTTANDTALWRSGNLVAREGDAAPGLSGLSYGGLNAPQMNAFGQTAYWSYLTGTGVDSSNNEALWRDGVLVARKGNATYIWNGVSYGSFYQGYFRINDAGQVGYLSQVTGSGVDSSNDEVLWRSGTPVAREGDPAPYLPGVRFGALSGAAPQINAAGQLLFQSYLTGTGVSSSADNALWIGDGGGDAVLVAREGQALAGSSIVGLSFYEGAFNDHGQVAYHAYLASGGQALMLFTPELHWRRSYSSNWDAAGNWSAGIAPGQVHPVIIDPAGSLTVTGPATDLTVKSLSLGGGNGQATLRLSSGVITVSDGSLIIQASGILTGDGKLNAAVTNQGAVQAQNITLTGDLNNLGLVGGSGRINARLVNQSGAEVRVGSGEFLQMGGGGHSNLGLVEVAGGQFQADGSFTNQSTGRVLLNDGSVRFKGGLSNHGQVLVTFGESSLFGSIGNESTGKIIVSQGALTTFYDTVTNKGTLRVSEGGAATFFGLLKGNATSGTGSVRAEGGWTPGFSPSVYTITNAFSLDSDLTMFLQGTMPGFCEATSGVGCHSKLIFSNLIELGTSSGLEVVLENGYAPTLGDTYDLFDWGTERTGTFSHVHLPDLAPGLVWNSTDLYSDGSIRVAAIPEASTWLMLLAGLGLIGARRVKASSRAASRRCRAAC